MRDQEEISGMDNHDLVYDVDLRAPACVLIQAAYGCDSSGALRYFDAAHWLLAPTPGMRKIAGTDEEWRRAAEITRKRWGAGSPWRNEVQS